MRKRNLPAYQKKRRRKRRRNIIRLNNEPSVGNARIRIIVWKLYIIHSVMSYCSVFFFYILRKPIAYTLSRNLSIWFFLILALRKIYFIGAKIGWGANIQEPLWLRCWAYLSLLIILVLEWQATIVVALTLDKLCGDIQ